MGFKLSRLLKPRKPTSHFSYFQQIQCKQYINDNKLDSDINYLTPRDKLIFGLFMLLPVRRPIDYLRIMLIDKEPFN